MAVPVSEDVESVNDDLQKLSLAQSYYHLSELVAWKDLMERLQALVDQAQQDHFSSRETDPYKIIEEKGRWQQRLLIQTSIKQIVESQLTTRASILEDMKEQEQNEHNA